MALKTHMVPIKDLQLFLRGAAIGRVMPPEGIYGLAGTSLDFSYPGDGTPCTFPLTPDPMPFLNIKNEIEAQVLRAAVFLHYGRIVIALTHPHIDSKLLMRWWGTANGPLGFDIQKDTESLWYGPPDGPAPRLIAFHQISDGFLQVVTDE